MRLAAIKSGHGVPDADFDGAVHSVFTNACIIAVEGAGLMTLIPKRAGVMPGAITIDTDNDLHFDQTAVAGTRAAARAGILRIAGSTISVDLRSASVWKSRLDSVALDLGKASTRNAWDVAADMLANDGRADKFLGIACDRIASLCAATRAIDLAKAGDHATDMIGLGDGGTPAGDDFLVGFLGALHAAAGCNHMKRDFVAAFGDRIGRATDRTNDVSRVYLDAAIAGEVSEKITSLITTIADGTSVSALRNAAAAAIAVGHSSGADGTLGLLAGMAAWGTRFPESAVDRLIAASPLAARSLRN